MIFGIWPGVAAVDLVDLTPRPCPPEDPAATLAALAELQGGTQPFYVRCYRHFGQANGARTDAPPTPADPGLYAGDGRMIDLVACYQTRRPDPEGFAASVRRAVRDVAAWGGGKVQVGEELNVPAPLDGGSPGCFEAVAAGLRAALEERDRSGGDVLIGINAAGMAEPAFWDRMAAAVGGDVLGRLDYVGLDAFPDVFRPIALDALPGAVRFLVEHFRAATARIGIPEDVPIHVTETGWPTGPEHDEATQAAVLDLVARTVLEGGLGVTAYEFFGLRDGLSGGDRFTRFGILRDDHSRKPAFDVVRRLVAEHAGHRQHPEHAGQAGRRCGGSAP